jgi:hypothetical protein
MLSVVELPPKVPAERQRPESPVVIPQHPCVPGEFTRIWPAGICANRCTRSAFML